MNDNTRNKFASYGLEILKRSVLLVLYEAIEVIPNRGYPLRRKRLLTAGQIRERLDIIQPRPVCANTNSLIYGILDYLRHDGHAYHNVGSGWQITEEGVKAIEGSA